MNKLNKCYTILYRKSTSNNLKYKFPDDGWTRQKYLGNCNKYIAFGGFDVLHTLKDW